ncbi:hypothetical protein ACFXDE_02150 [Kitasatospora sp. NPDC059408]|uniref:hypothetical protein n=1 Tax=Kitasatospora sp. NPDC059408 TaxID=3346823 RepID=UPI00369A7280
MLDHLDDLASDFSVFHRIGDITVLDGPTFLRFAWRMPAYEGVMRVRATAAREEDGGAGSMPQMAPGRHEEINPGTPAALRADPAFAGLFSYGSPGGESCPRASASPPRS